jgi:hypothetical protein
MGWLDNLWRRRQGRTTEATEDVVEAQRRQQQKDEELTADELEERAHEHRTEEVFREPRIPPGTG